MPGFYYHCKSCKHNDGPFVQAPERCKHCASKCIILTTFKPISETDKIIKAITILNNENYY